MNYNNLKWFLIFSISLVVLGDCSVLKGDISLDCFHMDRGIDYCMKSNELVIIQDKNLPNELQSSSSCPHLRGINFKEPFINCNLHYISLLGVRLTNENITSIALENFINPMITALILTTANKKLNFPKSSDPFDGLWKLESLTINEGIVSLETKPFKKLLFLSFLEIKVDGRIENFFSAFHENQLLTTLIISSDNFQPINRETFHGIHSGITDFQLKNCKIPLIRRGSFSPLVKLENLNINVESLSAIKPGAFDGLTHLNVLTIVSNRLSVIPANIFRGLKLKRLMLSSCLITKIEAGAFSGLHVSLLQLSDNNIKTLEPDTFKGIFGVKTLILSFNKLTTIPSNIFKSNMRLKKIELTGNSIQKVETNAFSGLVLEFLDLSNNNLTHFKAGGFAYVTTDFLFLPYNPIETIDINAFENCTVKKHFYISNVSHLLSTAPWGLKETGTFHISIY